MYSPRWNEPPTPPSRGGKGAPMVKIVERPSLVQPVSCGELSPSGVARARGRGRAQELEVEAPSCARRPGRTLVVALTVASCITLLACGSDAPGEACVGEDAEAEGCARCCEEAVAVAYRTLLQGLECSCVASAFCKDECAAQPFCATPRAPLNDACRDCLGKYVFSNCGADASFACRDDLACHDAITCLSSCGEN